MPGGSSAQRRAHVGHRNECAPRGLGVAERPEAELSVDVSAAFGVVVLEHGEDDGRSARLIGDPKTEPHRVYDEGVPESLAMHVRAYRNRPDVDDRDVADTGALPFPRTEIRPGGHCARGMEAQHCRIVACRGDPRSDHSILDLVRERRFQEVVDGAKATREGAAVMQRPVEFRDRQSGRVRRGLSRRPSGGPSTFLRHEPTRTRPDRAPRRLP